MSPTVRKAIGNVTLALVVAGLGAGAYGAWKRYGKINPYAGLDKKHVADPSAVIQATGVEIRHYEKGKRVASAEADKLTIGQDRNTIRLKGVRNGLAQSPEGPMQFAAGEGILRPLTKTIDVSQGVRVKGKGGVDFDIQSSRASINGQLGEIDVPTPLKGTIMGGQFVAASMKRRMNADYTRIVSPSWTGTLPKTAGVPASFQSKVWNFTGDVTTRQNGLNNADNGWASDGQMVITAPKLVHDPKTEVVTATSDGKTRATYHSAKADIVADKVVIYQKEKKAVCTGHVLVYVRPKKEWDKPLRIDDDDRGPLVPDIPPALAAKIGQGGALAADEKRRVEEIRSGKNVRDYPMQMAADEVTYWYKEGERRAIAKNGNPTAFQKFDDGRWRQVWAPEAHYDGEKDMLDLIGSTAKREVHFKNSIEDVTDCFTAKLSTKEDQTEEDEYYVLGKPKGHGIDFDDDKPKSGGAKPGAPAKAPPAKP